MLIEPRIFDMIIYKEITSPVVFLLNYPLLTYYFDPRTANWELSRREIKSFDLPPRVTSSYQFYLQKYIVALTVQQESYWDYLYLLTIHETEDIKSTLEKLNLKRQKNKALPHWLTLICR